MKKIRYISLILVVIAIGMLHFFTPGHLHFFHDTYRRLSYFPIVLGGIWFGMRGGLILAGLSSIAFIPHLLLFIGQESATYLSELTEIILYLAAGAVVGFIASKEAALREQYRLLSEKLERSYARLHEETALLIEVEEQLRVSQKLSALGEMAASLAHEIKNPLSSIKGTAEIFLDEFPEGHPKREFVTILLKEAARLNTTVEEVLQYSRPKGRDDADTEPLSEVIRRVAKLLESHLRKKNITLRLADQAVGEDFYVAGGRMTQVFLNIILNAIDASPSGGSITVRVERRQDGTTVAISDSGPGVRPADRQKIFEPFYSEREDGTGLGLAISRKIVESYGGTLTVNGAEEGGACFVMFLPARDKSPEKLN